MDAVPAAWFASQSAPEAVAPATLEAPNIAAERALAAWADARGIKIARPSRSTIPALTVDASVADAVEKELNLARDALTRLDADSTEQALARAGALLRDHPELPQAAWLLAEVDRGWAARWMRIAPADSERAARAWQRAAALDGGRAAGIGETAAPKIADISVTFSFDDDHVTALFVDGEATALGEKKIAPGEHAVVTKRSGQISWAAWVSVADREIVRIPAFRPTACSADDLLLARLNVAKNDVDARGVGCGEWMAATPLGASSLRLARCEGEHCGPWVTWQARATSLAPVPPPRHHKSKPATWVVVGAVVLAAALITGVTLVAAGAFDGPPHETKFVGGGVKPSSFPVIP